MTGTSEPSPFLRAQGVSKRFGRFVALENCTLDFPHGSVTLLLGANGAGKSTLLRLLCGLARADSGAVLLGGAPLAAGDRTAFGYLGARSGLYLHLTPAENIALFSKLLGREADPETYLAEWALREVSGRVTGELSRGYLARTALARAFVGMPKILLLDEPSTALDESSIRLLLEKIESTRSNETVLVIATHDVARFAPLANRLVVMRQGVVAHDSLKGSGSLAPLSATGTLELYLEAGFA